MICARSSGGVRRSAECTGTKAAARQVIDGKLEGEPARGCGRSCCAHGAARSGVPPRAWSEERAFLFLRRYSGYSPTKRAPSAPLWRRTLPAALRCCAGCTRRRLSPRPRWLQHHGARALHAATRRRLARARLARRPRGSSCVRRGRRCVARVSRGALRRGAERAGAPCALWPLRALLRTITRCSAWSATPTVRGTLLLGGYAAPKGTPAANRTARRLL
jgi:hypothetical protein